MPERSSTWRSLSPDDVQAFVEHLLSPGRDRPVVAVSTVMATRRPWVDPGQLAARLGDRAEVVLIETGELTWALNDLLPDKLECYGGAVRIWWPGLTPESDPYDHPLFLAFSQQDAERAVRQLVAALESPAAETSSRADWSTVPDEFKVGDVVEGRVHRLLPRGVLVELRPGVIGLVRMSELDWTFVEEPSDIVQPDQVVDVEILSLDVANRRADLSIKRALNKVPRRPLQVPEPRDVGGAGAVADRAPRAMAGEGPARSGQVELLQEDRAQLLRRLRELEKTLRAERDSAEHVRRRTAPEGDPLSSEPAFLLGVRLAYARLYGEGERQQHPLQRMRVGPGFLALLRELQGIGLEKVLEVCAQVAAGTAHEIRSREVHQLRAGDGGAGTRVRRRDGAKAWRCSLQDGTPAARRLHWWAAPSETGLVIEFASIGVHDDMSIPE